MSLPRSHRLCHLVRGTPRRRKRFFKLGLESLEPRYCLDAEMSDASSAVPTSIISEQQAIALALNHLTATDEGFVLENRQHTATFTSEGLLMEPTDGGPQWQWQLSYVGNSTDLLSEVQLGATVPESDGQTLVTYDRGLLIEQYVARADNVEQQFVIPAPLPLNGGDLIVAGKIHSNGEFEATDTGWQWRTDTGVISLGDVTVLDASGSIIPASMDVTASETRISIAADVLAAAAYPLLIDPEVGTNDFRISDMGPGATDFAALQPAVAYNSTNNEYLVVWYGDDVTNDDFEVFCERINALTGTEVGLDDIRISDMGPDGSVNFVTTSPAVAYNSTNNEYLVVWSGEDDTAPLVDNDREIFGQRIDGATGVEVGANDFRISDMGPDGNTGFSAIDPAVTYNSRTNEYLVVWNGDDNIAPLVIGEREIFGQRLSAATGTEVGTNDFRISDMGPDGSSSFAAQHPAVAFNFNSNQFLVVWTGDDNTAPLVDNEREIFGQRLDATGVAQGANDFRISDMGPDGNTSFSTQVPAVVHNTLLNQYLVVWQGDDNVAPLVDNEGEIFGQVLNSVGGLVGADDFRISDMGVDGDTQFAASAPAVVFDKVNQQYLVTWVGDESGSPFSNDEFEIFGQRLDMTGAAIGTNDFRVSDVGPDGDALFDALLPALAFNSTNNQHLVVWTGNDTADDGNEIFGQRLDSAGVEVGSNDFQISGIGSESSFNVFEPAVAYNSTQGEYLVVWAGDDLNNKFEIFGQRINAATGAEVGSNDFQISFTGAAGDILVGAAKAAVAFGGNEYLVVWDADIAANQEVEIVGQRLNANDGSPIGSNFRISDIGPDGQEQHSALEPAVAFNSDNGEFIVVWRGDDILDGEFEIFGQRLLNGTAIGTNDFRISDMGLEGDPAFDAFFPEVAYNASSDEYLVVWQGNDRLRLTDDNEVEIYGQRLSANTGAPVGLNDFRISEMGPTGNVNFGAAHPAIAASNNGYLVVWDGDNSVDNEFEIFGQAFKYVAGDLIVERDDFRISDMGPDGNAEFDARFPSVSFRSTGDFAVVWSGDDNISPLVDNEFEVFGQQITAIGALETGANDFRISDMGPNGVGGFGAVFTAIAADTTTFRVLVVWDGIDSGNGEHEIFGQLLEVGDFGDAPISYSTLQANSGAWHGLGGSLFLGATVDGDANGTPTDNATGDDTTDIDDEDGVTLAALTPGSLSTVHVVSSAAGKLDAFLDFNRDGDFADAGEKIFDSLAVTAGTNSLSFAVPATAVSGGTFARFRLSSSGGLSFSGRANDGEVEDYAVSIEKVCFGTADADVLLLRPVSNPAGTVICNRVTGAGEVTLQTFAPTEPVIVMALAGADAVSVVSGVTRGVVIDGGAGNDQIIGGITADLLLGGDGDDWLLGGDGKDVLIGGTGSDTLLGGYAFGGVGRSSDENLLIGDSTVYDNQGQALREILEEWSSTGSFAKRVTKIRSGEVSEPLTPATVVDDHATDLLIGLASRNWFWKLSLDLFTLFGADDELN